MFTVDFKHHFSGPFQIVLKGLIYKILNRLLLHPKFGSYIVLNTILIDRIVNSYDKTLENPTCGKCQLCTSACPVEAISADGNFNFVNCMTHNYRDRPIGFQGWVEHVVSINKKKYINDIGKPFKDRNETIYVIANSDGSDYEQKN